MKTLGILGGMGPKATAVLYDRIVDATCAERDQDHIKTIILSDTEIPDRTEAILEERTDELREKLIEDARRLEGYGAEVMIMPCNTAHHFIDDIRGRVGSTVIDMVDTAVEDALEKTGEGAAIGIMATDGTVASKIYDRALQKRGASAVYPSAEAQEILMSIIYDDIKNGKIPDDERIREAASELESRCDGIILACTELSVCRDRFPEKEKYVDAMDSVVFAAIEACGAQKRDTNEIDRKI